MYTNKIILKATGPFTAAISLRLPLIDTGYQSSLPIHCKSGLFFAGSRAAKVPSQDGRFLAMDARVRR